jgi:hypothetical protein
MIAQHSPNLRSLGLLVDATVLPDPVSRWADFHVRCLGVHVHNSLIRTPDAVAAFLLPIFPSAQFSARPAPDEGRVGREVLAHWEEVNRILRD